MHELYYILPCIGGEKGPIYSDKKGSLIRGRSALVSSERVLDRSRRLRGGIMVGAPEGPVCSWLG